MPHLRPRPRRSAWSPGFWAGFGACGVVLVLVVPILNLWVSPNSAAALPDYLVPLIGKYVCYALLALSLDLIWGFAGVLILGHGAFFALGGYCMGMHLMRQIGTRGVYGNPLLPDFMVFLNWPKLPWFWWGFDHFAWTAAMVVLLSVAWDPSAVDGTRFSHTRIPDQEPLHSEAISAGVLAQLSDGRQLLRGNTLFGPDRTTSLVIEVWQDSG